MKNKTTIRFNLQNQLGLTFTRPKYIIFVLGTLIKYSDTTKE